MSKRHELLRHIASLSDIGELLDAMQGLALVESRRIAQFIDAQRTVVDIVQTTLNEFLAHHPQCGQPPPGRDEVLCFIGTQRGFCGDLNTRLIDSVRDTVRTTDGSGPPFILVGSQLSDAWPRDAAEPAAQIPGASFADEVHEVLLNLSAAIATALRDTSANGLPAVTLHHADNTGIRRRPLFPPRLATGGTPQTPPLALYLPPPEFHRALLEQYLEVTLNSVLFEALLFENEQRLQHMEQARHRTDERIDDLSRRANRARQEEIINEIEVLLISDLATTD